MITLEQIGILQGLAHAEKLLFRRIFQSTLEFKTGETIIARGNQSNGFIVILDGTVIVNIFGRQKTVSAGEIIGEINLFAPGGRTADVMAGPRGATAMFIEQERLDFFRFNHPQIAHVIIQNIAPIIANRLAEITQFMREFQEAISRREGDYQSLVEELSRALILGKIPLLGQLTSTEREIAYQSFWEKEYQPGTQLITAGSVPNPPLCLITRGYAMVEDLVRLQVGDVIGEISFVTGGPRTANVFAGDKGTQVRVFLLDEFKRFAFDYPATAGKITYALTALLAFKFRQTMEVLAKYQQLLKDMSVKQPQRKTTSLFELLIGKVMGQGTDQ